MTLTSSPNHFLCSLSPHDAALIEPHLRPVHLPRKTTFYNAEDILERVYFPYSGIISIVVAMSGGKFVEAGMLGRNGVVGAGSALDGRWALNTAISQADSSGTCHANARCRRLGRGHQCACCPLPSRSKPQPTALQATAIGPRCHAKRSLALAIGFPVLTSSLLANAVMRR